MRSSLSYLFCSLLILAFCASSCGDRKRLNDRITLWRNDKIPYGTYYAHEYLTDIFPSATVYNSSRNPDQYTSFEYESPSSDKHKLSYIIVASKVMPGEDEQQAMFNLVYQGAQVFISSFSISEPLLDSLKLRTGMNNSIYNKDDSLTVSIIHPEKATEQTFSYPGKALDNYFSEVDSSITTVLGKDAQGRANYVRISYDGGGAFFIHLAPAALSNFFLLHKNNKEYYDEVFSWLPKNAESLRWDDYFRNSSGGKRKNGDNNNTKGDGDIFKWMLNQPGLAWFMWLLLALLLLIYLFESKRRQRIIPVIKPLNNASLDFVKTIGRLYFQRKDNRDLAHKMTIHFLSYVRSRYNIRTAEMNEDFVQKLAHKSGYDLEGVRSLVYDLNYSQHSPEFSDHALLELNFKLDQFYHYNT